MKLSAPISRRDALQTLGAVSAGAALSTLFGGRLFGEDAKEPFGNLEVDKNLARFEEAPLQMNSVRDRLAMLSGPGGNMAVLASDSEGALLVDTGVHYRAPSIAKAAEEFARGPVSRVVNTHWHFDHTGGNEFFGRRGNPIVAHGAVRTRMSAPQNIEMFDFTFPPSPAAAWPSVTLTDTLTLHLGDEVVHLLHVPPAHTDGDLLVHFTKANVLHLGDTLFNGFYPFIDYSSGGWIGGMVGAAARGLALCDDKTKIIPGHGPLADRVSLKAALDMLTAVQGNVEKLLDDGKSVDEVVTAAPTKAFDEKWGKGFFGGEAFARTVTTGILRHRDKS